MRQALAQALLAIAQHHRGPADCKAHVDRGDLHGGSRGAQAAAATARMRDARRGCIRTAGSGCCCCCRRSRAAARGAAAPRPALPAAALCARCLLGAPPAAAAAAPLSRCRHQQQLLQRAHRVLDKAHCGGECDALAVKRKLRQCNSSSSTGSSELGGGVSGCTRAHAAASPACLHCRHAAPRCAAGRCGAAAALTISPSWRVVPEELMSISMGSAVPCFSRYSSSATISSVTAGTSCVRSSRCEGQRGCRQPWPLAVPWAPLRLAHRHAQVHDSLIK